MPAALEERLAASPLPAAVETTLPVPVDGSPRLVKVVVTRDEAGVLRAFENFCPHQGGTLFLAPNGELRCRLHGAQFRLRDGLCTGGPCAGALLTPLPLTSADEDCKARTTLPSLVALSVAGSGGRKPPAGWKPSAEAQQLLDAFASSTLQ